MIETSASFSLDNTLRWTLFRKWGDSGRRCLWVMLNPSTADANTDDPTIMRCIRFSKLWGFDELSVVNLYPFRSSDPIECQAWIDPQADDWFTTRLPAIARNLEVVQEEAAKALTVIAAWGTGDWYQDHASVVNLRLEEYPLYCLGTTKSGAPKHPLARGRSRVPSDQRPILYRDKAPIEAGI